MSFIGLHDRARLWPVLTLSKGKVWNYLVIFIIDILNNHLVLLFITAITPNSQVRFGIIFDFLPSHLTGQQCQHWRGKYGKPNRQFLPWYGGEVVQHPVVLLGAGLVPPAALGEGEDGSPPLVAASSEEDKPLLQQDLHVLTARSIKSPRSWNIMRGYWMHHIWTWPRCFAPQSWRYLFMRERERERHYAEQEI